MTQANYFTLAMGALALVLQFTILRLNGEKQRYEGRILLLLGKLADKDLEETNALRRTVTDLLEQKHSFA